MTEEAKKLITQEKHPGRVAQCHKLAAPMKKKKEELLRIKEQSTVESTEQPSVPSAVQSDYVYGVGILAVRAIGVCVFFAYNTFQPKKQANEKQDKPPKRRHMLQKKYAINE